MLRFTLLISHIHKIANWIFYKFFYWVSQDPGNDFWVVRKRVEKPGSTVGGHFIFNISSGGLLLPTMNIGAGCPLQLFLLKLRALKCHVKAILLFTYSSWCDYMRSCRQGRPFLPLWFSNKWSESTASHTFFSTDLNHEYRSLKINQIK